MSNDCMRELRYKVLRKGENDLKKEKEERKRMREVVEVGRK